ncbi:hypothetical protein [Nocardioides sp. URHA0032]|uniref:hypothetical protein n=1 Tax=Nocardioides sp. URHA0032 TaxID=1380388 RepID=UPI00048CDB75|nr:hypothetical protein [Nocardioides sp. URHA0032]
MYALPLDPDSSVQYRTVDDEPDPSANSVRIRYLYGSMLLHREHDLFVAQSAQGRHAQDLIRTRLRAERFSTDDSDEWAFRNWRKWWSLNELAQHSIDQPDEWMCDLVVQVALAYRDTGIPNDEAFEWVIRSVSPDYALSIRNHGWNPHAYGTLCALCIQRATPDRNDDNEADRWIASPIVWWRALRYLQAGFRLPDALGQELRRRDGEDVDAAVDVLIGLRHSDQP